MFQLRGTVVAALDNNARDDNGAMVIRENETNQRRSLNFSGTKPSTPILDTVNFPIHMKNLSVQVKLKINEENICNFILFLFKICSHICWFCKFI